VNVSPPTDPNDFYSILGLRKTAKEKSIKSAYRKLALKYHPDKVKEDKKKEAEKIFIKVSEAYAVLSDKEKQKVYDKYGKWDLKATESGMDPEEAVFELFPTGGKVARLGKPKFPDSKSKHVWLVVFYTNDSQACAQAKPALEQLAEKASFKVGAVDCGRNEREALFCADKGVEKNDVPRFAVVVNGKLTFLEEKDAIPSAKALHDFCVDNMPRDLIQNIIRTSLLRLSVLITR
jgi:curved DNA-binding protein CbpA